MADSYAVVTSWGGLSLATGQINSLPVQLDNAAGAVAAFGGGARMVYLEQTYFLSHAPAVLYEVFPGVTTQAAFDALLAARAGSPNLVLKLTLTRRDGAGADTWYFSDQVLAGVSGLYLRAVFTGLIDSWAYTLNEFTLTLTGTERAEEKTLPGISVSYDPNAVTAGVGITWPNAPNTSNGKPYPEVFGSPGKTLDANKIEDGFGSIPAILVDRAALKYVLAGHGMTLVADAVSGTVALWCKIPGYDGGYGYIEGCIFDLSDVDAKGDPIAWVELPAVVVPKVYLPTLTAGSYFTNTAGNPDNACGRDASVSATVNHGQLLVLALAVGLENGGKPLQVWIVQNNVSADLRARWVGPQSTIVGTGAGYIDIDSAAGWDSSGKVQVAGGVKTYTTVTSIAANQFRLAIAGYAGSDTGSATMVGDWQTFASGNEVEVSSQRNWENADFYKFELELENTHASNNYSVSFLGLRVLEELTGYPDVYVPCDGIGISFRSVSYGASQNPALILKDVHTRLLGLAEAQIGTTFDAALALLSAWKMDLGVVEQRNSPDLLKDLTGQCKAFLWRDGDNAVQIGIYRLDDVASLTLDSATDIIDLDGNSFLVGFTAPEEVQNRLYLSWGYDYSRKQTLYTYFIREDGSYPPDSVRELAAAASQAEYGVTNTLRFEAPHIQDATTALLLLQFLFDFKRVRRRKLTFGVPAQVKLNAGTIVLVNHPLLSQEENFLIESMTRQGDVLQLSCIALAVQAVFSDLVGLEVKASASVDHLYGDPEFFNPFGGYNVSTVTETVGRAVDYGLSLWASRFFQDTAEKPAYGAIGTGAAAPAAGDVALGGQLGNRGGIAPGYPTRSGTEVDVIFTSYTAIGGAGTFREIGIFSGASGNNLLGRVTLAADASLPQDTTATVTFKITAKRPTAGSAVTDYGLALVAQRIYQDTAEKPAYYAIGTDGTAQAGSDVALGAQIGARQAFAAGYPLFTGLAMALRTLFAGASYGPNTIREAGVFTGAAGSNAVLRKVPAPFSILATQDTTIAHEVGAANYS